MLYNFYESHAPIVQDLAKRCKELCAFGKKKAHVKVSPLRIDLYEELKVARHPYVLFSFDIDNHSYQVFIGQKEVKEPGPVLCQFYRNNKNLVSIVGPLVQTQKEKKKRYNP